MSDLTLEEERWMRLATLPACVWRAVQDTGRERWIAHVEFERRAAETRRRIAELERSTGRRIVRIMYDELCSILGKPGRFPRGAVAPDWVFEGMEPDRRMDWRGTPTALMFNERDGSFSEVSLADAPRWNVEFFEWFDVRNMSQIYRARIFRRVGDQELAVDRFIDPREVGANPALLIHMARMAVEGGTREIRAYGPPSTLSTTPKIS